MALDSCDFRGERLGTHRCKGRSGLEPPGQATSTHPMKRGAATCAMSADRSGAPGAARRLRDVLVDRPRSLFFGINPGLRSAQLGHHFAGPGDPFWRLLHAAGIVPELLTFERDRDLARHGLALTNLCPRPTRSAAELTPEEKENGSRALAAKVARLRPAVVAFVGLTVYQRCVKERLPGPGAKPAPFAGARVFALPNPSGLNASFPGFAHKLVWYRELAEFAKGSTPALRRAGARIRGRTPGRSSTRSSRSVPGTRSSRSPAGSDPSSAGPRRRDRPRNPR